VGASKLDQKTLRRLSMDYYLNGEVLYKRSFDETLLRCLNEKEVKKALQELLEGICAIYIYIYIKWTYDDHEDINCHIFLDDHGERLCGLCKKKS